MPKSTDLIIKTCAIPNSELVSIRVPYKGKHVRTALHIRDFMRFVDEGYKFRISKIKEFLYLVAEHPDRPGKRVYVHRAVKPELLENPDCVVHHKDLNTLNNDPDNLDIMTIAAHNKLHRLLRTEAKIAREASNEPA